MNQSDTKKQMHLVQHQYYSEVQFLNLLFPNSPTYTALYCPKQVTSECKTVYFGCVPALDLDQLKIVILVFKSRDDLVWGTHQHVRDVFFFQKVNNHCHI